MALHRPEIFLSSWMSPVVELYQQQTCETVFQLSAVAVSVELFAGRCWKAPQDTGIPAVWQQISAGSTTQPRQKCVGVNCHQNVARPAWCDAKASPFCAASGRCFADPFDCCTCYIPRTYLAHPRFSWSHGTTFTQGHSSGRDILKKWAEKVDVWSHHIASNWSNQRFFWRLGLVAQPQRVQHQWLLLAGTFIA